MLFFTSARASWQLRFTKSVFAAVQASLSCSKFRFSSVFNLPYQIETEESWRQVLTSLVVCLFARGIYTPDIISTALKHAGFNLTEQELKAVGEKIYRDKCRYNLREGF